MLGSAQKTKKPASATLPVLVFFWLLDLGSNQGPTDQQFADNDDFLDMVVSSRAEILGSTLKACTFDCPNVMPDPANGRVRSVALARALANCAGPDELGQPRCSRFASLGARDPMQDQFLVANRGGLEKLPGVSLASENPKLATRQGSRRRLFVCIDGRPCVRSKRKRHVACGPHPAL